MSDHQSETAEVARSRTCYWMECSDCGDDSWEEGIPHFETETALWEALLGEDGYGWSYEKHGRPLCRSCTDKADCAREGHQMAEWRPHGRDPGVVWRYCERCNSQLEEHLLALGEPPSGNPTPPGKRADT